MKSADLFNLLISLGYLSVFILLGQFLRARVKIVQKLFLPAPLLGGIIALILGPGVLKVIPESIVNIWGMLPARLIEVVFAGVFLGAVVPNVKKIVNFAGAQLTFAYLLDAIQWVLGLGIALLVLQPIWGINPMIGNIIEIGWYGGPGTAAGMVEVFKNIGFPEGGDLGMVSATVGLLSGVIFGVILINIAVRKGYCEAMPIGSSGDIENVNITGIQDEKVVAKSVIHNGTVDPFTFHAGLIFIAIVMGNYMLQGLKLIHPIFDSVPVFPLGMIGGLIIQIIMVKTRKSYMIDKQCVERIQGISLDIMVASAVATIKISVVVKYVVPLLILFISTIVVMILVTWFLGRYFFRNAWFEKSIAEFGSATGVIATSLLLLRMVDPDYKTEAPKSFAFSRPLISPFIGGGLVTSMVPIFAYQFGPWKVVFAWTGIIILLIIIAYINKWLVIPSKGNTVAKN